MSLDLVAQAIQRLEPDQRTARLDRFIRRRTAALEDASRSLRPLYWVPSVVMAICLIATSSLALTMPLWWYNLGLFFFLLVSGAWDLVAYRRTAPERRFPLQSSTLQMNLTDPQPRVEDWERFSRDGRVLRINDATLGMIDAGERRPIREWQQQHPGLWMLIEVTLEEEWGASEGKLIATAKDYAEFDELYVSYSDRYLLAVYGKR